MDRGDCLLDIKTDTSEAATPGGTVQRLASRLSCGAWLGWSRVPARAGRALEPTVIAVHSQRVHAELNGWRTPGGIILREPIQASVEYTPALARHGMAFITSYPFLTLL